MNEPLVAGVGPVWNLARGMGYLINGYLLLSLGIPVWEVYRAGDMTTELALAGFIYIAPLVLGLLILLGSHRPGVKGERLIGLGLAVPVPLMVILAVALKIVTL